MKKIIFVINICLIFSTYSGIIAKKNSKYKEKKMKKLKSQINVAEGVNKEIYISYLSNFSTDWSDFEVSNTKVISKLKKYSLEHKQ